MPLFDFRCSAGHVNERLVTADTLVVACPECGEPAEKRYGAPAMIVGPTLHPNLRMDGRWQDAKARADIGFSQIRS